jgi:hypothetical protein
VLLRARAEAFLKMLDISILILLICMTLNIIMALIVNGKMIVKVNDADNIKTAVWAFSFPMLVSFVFCPILF